MKNDFHYSILSYLSVMKIFITFASSRKYNYEAGKESVHCLQRQKWILKRFFPFSLARIGTSAKGQTLTEKNCKNTFIFS